MYLQYYIKNTNEAVIIQEKAFASGGEGTLHEIQKPARFIKHVAKIFHPKKRDQEKERKIEYLINNPPYFEYSPEHQPIIWVEQALYNEKDEFVGFIMPRASGEKLEILCSPKLPRYLGPEWDRLRFGHDDALRLRLKVCYNLSAAIHQIHATGRYVLVDLKPDNILIKSNGVVSIVDTDSIEVVENGKTIFPATVVTPEYTPAEYYKGVKPGKSVIDQSWDHFSLAVIFYRLMLGVHPFAASALPPHDNLSSLGDKIQHGLFVHDSSKQSKFSIIPPPHKKFHDLDEDLQKLFIRTLASGHTRTKQRSSAEEWGKVILNSPILLIDRPLPSRSVKINTPSNQNWYDVALQSAIKEFDLEPPKPISPDKPALMQNSANTIWEDAKHNYKVVGESLWVVGKFLGIVGIVVMVFTFLVSAFSEGDPLGALLLPWTYLGYFVTGIFSFIGSFPPILLVGLAPLFAALFSRGLGSINNAAKDTSFIPSGKYKKKHLEDMQYALFSKRVKLKQRLQEIKTELNVLGQVKQKKEKEFNKSLGKFNHGADSIEKRLKGEMKSIQKKDEVARLLMKEEAQAIREYQADFQKRLEAYEELTAVTGTTVEQKIQTVEQWMNNSQLNAAPNGLASAKEEHAGKLKVLKDLKSEHDTAILEIRQRFDEQHKILLEEVKTYQVKMDEMANNVAKDIREEIKIDTKLLNKSYRKLLRTRNELMEEMYDEENQLVGLNDKIKQIRNELAKRP